MQKIVWITLFCNLAGGTVGFPQTLDEIDTLYAERGKESFARQALSLYRKKVEASAEDSEALWRLSMAAHFVGMRYGKDEEEKETLFKEGKEFGLRAIELKPNCAACYFWTAINMALYGETVGVFKMLFSLKEILALLEKSASLDPKYALAGAYRVQGIIYQKLPGIFGGDNDKAKTLFEKAIEHSPCELNYVVLATFIRDVEDNARKASLMAQEALRLPACEPIETKEAREELKAFLIPSLEPRLSSSTQNHSLE